MALPIAERKLVNLPEITYTPSPNQSQRIHGNTAVDLIIVHTPEGSWESAINTVMGTARPVSYHLLIHQDGKIARQFAKWSRKAWHAGAYNSRSDGIAIAGFAHNTRAFSPAGRAAARAVAKRLKDRGLPPKWRRKGERGGGFCRHADIQSDRRDPMPLGRWLAFVAMVKWQYARGGFRKSWGVY
jgi:N-acetyl-anhydromuramyl-L-alanine amidase AmpD